MYGDVKVLLSSKAAVRLAHFLAQANYTHAYVVMAFNEDVKLETKREIAARIKSSIMSICMSLGMCICMYICVYLCV